MGVSSLFGPAKAGSSTILNIWLFSQLSFASGLSFHTVSEPELDLLPLGRVALTGNFDAVTFYSYIEQSKSLFASNGSQSILTPLPNGILTAISASDADIRAMCPFTQQDGTNPGIFVAGNFTSLGGVEAHGVALYEPESNKVTALPGLAGSVSALLCDQESNSVYVGGEFKHKNSSNAAAWVGGQGWTSLPFGGFNGPVTSIAKDDDHIIFAGSFNGVTNSTSPKKKNRQVINLQDATISSSVDSSRSGLSDPRNIICQTSGGEGEGETWLLGDYALGFWRADMRFTFKPSTLRLYNTHLEGRGTKSFLFRALPDNGIMNLTYTDPDTGDEVHCDQYCPLSSDRKEKYRDFQFVNNIGMSGFMVEVRDWYGVGAGLNGIELFTNDTFAYAVNDFNEPACAGISHSSRSTRKGSWTVTESTQGASDYLTADVTDSTAANTAIVFEPDVKQSGNYSILLYTPGCNQDGTCASRGIVNVTATVRSNSESTEPIETQIYQTNLYDKYDTIYTGPVDTSGDSFRPSVTLTPLPGQGDLTVVASRVKFEQISTSGSSGGSRGSSGELNGLFDFDPSSKKVNTDFTKSTINRAGLSMDEGAEVKSLTSHAGVVYVAGNFSTSGIKNILRIPQDSNATALSEGGLNSEVTSMAVLNSTLYAGGRFTSTSKGGNDDLKHVAAYSIASNKWLALGGGVNGPVKKVIALPLNVSSELNETVVAISGDFNRLLAFDNNPSSAASGFAVWVPSRNNWLQNLNVTQSQYTGQLSAFAESNGTTILAGSLITGGTAAGAAVSLLYDDGLNLDPLLKTANTSGETVTGLYDTSSDRNLTILGGHFTTTTSNGSTIKNLALLDGSEGTISGLPAGVDSNSTFLALAVGDNILYAGGRLSGKVGQEELGGFVLYDLDNGTFTPDQPPKLMGEDVAVNAIAVKSDSTDVYVGGQFDTAGSLPCPGICVYDTSEHQWYRPGAINGNVLALKWASNNALVAVGRFELGVNETVIATYYAEERKWEAFEGASTSSIPGTITAFTPASVDVSRFWLSGESKNGSSYLVHYDGSSFQFAENIFGDGTVIRGLEVLPLSADHDEIDLLNNDQILLVSGRIEIPHFGSASAALFNGTNLVPFVLSSTSDGQPGSISQMFYQNSNPYAREDGHRSNGIVVLVAFCCALGCVFLIVIAGVIFNKIQRRRQGYMQAPQAAGTDRPSNMRRLPPEYLFNSLKQPNPGAPAI